jgi:rubredoxin
MYCECGGATFKVSITIYPSTIASIFRCRDCGLEYEMIVVRAEGRPLRPEEASPRWRRLPQGV